MPSIAELNKIIGRIKDVQQRFGGSNGKDAALDNSFSGRAERTKVGFSFCFLFFV
jgi:hypothetical protein